MRCELIAPDSPRWTSVLARTEHDFYHLPGYARSTARLQGGQASALLVSDGQRDLLQPLVIRELGEASRDATSPYGFAGPLSTDRDDPGFHTEAMRHAAGFLAAEGFVSLFVRLHPLLNSTPLDIETVVRDGEAVVIDLRLSDDEARRQLRWNHRNQIDRARRSGHRVIMDAGPAYEIAFQRLYRETMERIGADGFYAFDDRYFRDLHDVLGDRLHIAVVEIEHEVAAAALFVEGQGIVHYHLSGSAERFRREAPTKLIIDEGRRWAKQRGHRWLHLGGGYAFADDGLFLFKAGFSRTTVPVHSLRMVLLPDVYDHLVRVQGGPSEPSPSATYFPAYRRPPRHRHVGPADPPAGEAGSP